MTSGTGGSATATRSSLAGLPHMTVEEVPLDRWWAALQEAAVEPVPDAGAGSTCAADEGWTLLLVEGERIDLPALQEAVRSGRPALQPHLQQVASVAPDPFASLQPRLLPGRRTAAEFSFIPVPSAVRTRGAEAAGVPQEGWTLTTVPAANRHSPAVRVWARDVALDLTCHQAVTGAPPPPLTAALLLLAEEWDAVLSRADSASVRRCSAAEAAFWSRAAVAAATCAGRWSDADTAWRRWSDADVEGADRALAAVWRTVIDVARDDLAQVREPADDEEVLADPWTLVQARTVARHRVEAVAGAVRGLLASTAPTDDLDRLVELWRSGGLDPEELLRGWPGTDIAALHRGLATCEGRSAGWWLRLADAVQAHQPIPAVIEAAGRIAARTGTADAVRWARHARDAGLPGPDALHQRATDPGVEAVQRVVAAACTVPSATAGTDLLEQTLARVDDTDAFRLLVAVDEAAPRSLPEVVRAFCADDDRVEAMQDAMRRVGAAEQAEALEGLRRGAGPRSAEPDSAAFSSDRSRTAPGAPIG